MRCISVVLLALAAYGLSPSSLAQSSLPVEPLAQCSRLTSLVISEIMYHPAKRADGRDLEFIELFNSGATPEDISGYRLSGDVAYTFPAGTTIAAQGFLVVARNPADLMAVTGLAGVLGPFEGSAAGALPDSGGTIELRHRTGAVFLTVAYRGDPPWPAAADGAGHSLVLARPSLGERDPNAWAASDAIGGSPGKQDPVSTDAIRSVVINEFLAHTDDPELDYIELYNHSNQGVDLSGAILTDDARTNKFLLPPNTVIPARGFLSFRQDQLGFALSSAGETIYFKDAADARVIDAVRFGGQENGVATGRYPDGGRQFYRLQMKTPGAPNAPVLQSEVIINELMYHPISDDDNDQFVELFNRGAAPVNLEGWRIEEGISFTFPTGSVLAANGYAVVARDSARLLANYPKLSPGATWGDFKGKLSGTGERIVLTKPDTIVSTNQSGVLETNVIHIAEDEVDYRDGGRWGKWSDGGGSSLERIDPRNDGRLASSWADSNESAKAGWTEVTRTGRIDNGDVAADQLQVLLQGAGECLIDNVEVIDGAGVNRIANSTFENDASGWTAEGVEDQSSWEASEGFNSSHSYHVRALDRGDNQVNRIRTPLTSALAAGSTATIRARVRWLKGHPTILFRLRGNWLEAAGEMTLPKNLGTPGEANSRLAANGAPAIFDVSHAPVAPAAGQSVVVTARASDPDGIASVQLKYRVDPGTSYSTVTMNDDGTGGDAVANDGLFSGTIPGQSSGSQVAFYIQAADGATPPATSVFPDLAPAAEGLVRFGESTPAGTFPVYRIWMTQATFNTWSARSKLNNTPLPVTFVLGNGRVIYDARALYAGSPYIAPGYSTPSGNRCGYSVLFPSDDRFLGDTDLVLDWPGGHGNESTAMQEQMAYWLADRMDLPYSHRYCIRLYVHGVSDLQRGTVFEAVNQPAGEFVKAWSPDDSNGDFYKIDRAFEFSDNGGLTADPQPRLQNYTTVGGAKKTERYRWTWLKRSTANVNDYSNVFYLVDALNAAAPEPYTSQTEELVDTEEWMGILATEHIIVNFDAYGHEIGKNMYSYKPQNGRWQLYMFDLDWLMLAAAGRRSDYAASVAPLFNSEDPTMTRMYNHPPFRRAYFRAVKNAVDGPMLAANCNPVMDEKYQALLANGINRCDGQALTDPGAVKTWFAQRRAFLAGQLSTLASTFAITSNGGADFTTNATAATLTGSAPIEVKGLRVNGVDYPVTWTSVVNWAVTVPLRPGANPFVIQAYDVAGQPLAGLEARIGITSHAVQESPIGKVLITEIMCRPSVPGAEFIELFNSSSSTAFDLSGWLVDGVDFTFVGGSIIGPNGYAVIVKDRPAFIAAYGSQVPIAGEFAGKLDPNGETLSLWAPGEAGNAAVLADVAAYDTRPPWPEPAPGASLQLIDASQDNFRVANWGVASASADPGQGPQWQEVTATGTASTSRLYIYMSSEGEVDVDDLQLVAGEVAGAGENMIKNGDFESAFPGPWTVSANLSGSSVRTAAPHGGNGSLHVVSSAPGTSQSTSIWQDMGPLVTNATYTLSYWYRPTTNGTAMTIRLSGSGINSVQNVAAAETPVVLASPGAANSIKAALAPLPPVWINELAPNNSSGLADASGQFEPWVELYNAGDKPVSLEGWYLADNFTNLTQWPFPGGTAIGPKEFLLVWLDGNTGQSTPSELHASFRLPSAAGSLALVCPLSGRSVTLDSARYDSVAANKTLGLFPDGQGGPLQVFASPTPGQPNHQASSPVPLWINEWMAANTHTIADPADGHFDDWIELFNPNDAAVDLGGFALADSLTNSFARWPIPAGTLIQPHGYLLVWADNDVEQNAPGKPDLHAGFQLSREGETIALFAPNGQVVDAVTYAAQTDDASYGRSPDGSTSLGPLSPPTPGAANGGGSNAPPEIQRIVLSGAQLSLAWTAQPGRTYRVLASDDVQAVNWTALLEIVAASSVESHTLDLPAAPRRFYRIELANPTAR